MTPLKNEANCTTEGRSGIHMHGDLTRVVAHYSQLPEVFLRVLSKLVMHDFVAAFRGEIGALIGLASATSQRRNGRSNRQNWF